MLQMLREGPAPLIRREDYAQPAYWIRKAELVFDEAQRPAKLMQSGWTIEYRDYVSDDAQALPRKVFATKGKQRVRLFIEDWQVR